MLELEAIFFDLDGTLVDSARDITNAVNHMLRELALEERSYEEVVSFIGGGVDDLISKSLGQADDRAHDAGRAVFDEYYREHSDEESVLYPNVVFTLEHFKDKKLAIVTNRASHLAEISLRALGIDRYFSDIVGGERTDCLKPSACPLEEALAGASCAVPKERAMMVGDMATDVEAAKKAGIYSCAVTYGFGRREDIERSAPDIIIDDILELKEKVR